MTHNIFGCVVVNGKEYEDDAIASLIGKDVTGWSHAGDQSPEEACICVDDDTFDDLPSALAFIKEKMA